MADYKVVGQYEYAKGIRKIMPNFPPSSIDKIKTFPFQEGDIVVASYPKSGSVWASQIVTLIANKGDNETEAMKTNLNQRVRFMEVQSSPQGPANVDILASSPAPRFTKTHLPAQIFKQGLDDGKAKFIIIMRNPKDCLVSFYHFYRAMSELGNFPGTFTDFFELFKAKGLIDGDWLDVNLGWWSERHRDNVLIMKYEDMKRDPRSAILRCASFCGTALSDDVIENIIKESTFKSMETNTLTNMTSLPKFVYDHSISPFIRKGIIGDWKNVFTKEQSDYVDEHWLLNRGWSLTSKCELFSNCVFLLVDGKSMPTRDVLNSEPSYEEMQQHLSHVKCNIEPKLNSGH